MTQLILEYREVIRAEAGYELRAVQHCDQQRGCRLEFQSPLAARFEFRFEF